MKTWTSLRLLSFRTLTPEGYVKVGEDRLGSKKPEIVAESRFENHDGINADWAAPTSTRCWTTALYEYPRKGTNTSAPTTSCFANHTPNPGPLVQSVKGVGQE